MNWSGKRVFVTGGAGFLGSHLCKKLESLGAEIGLLIHVNESPLPARRYYGNLAESTPNLFHFLSKFKPEIVFHLASQPLVSVAMLNELETLQVNVGGTYNLLHACRSIHGVKSFVHISTDKVYGNTNPITKDSIPAGTLHPYNASKMASDYLAQMYSNFFDVPMVIIRNSNVYGAGDKHFDRIVPRTIRQVLLGKKPIIRGDGSSTRDYIHVDELVGGYIRAAELPYEKKLSILNLSGFNHSVFGIVDTILEKMRRVDLAPIFEDQWKGEIPHQHIENDLAKELIGWNPQTDLKDGLDKTIPWYREFLSGK